MEQLAPGTERHFKDVGKHHRIVIARDAAGRYTHKLYDESIKGYASDQKVAEDDCAVHLENLALQREYLRRPLPGLSSS